MNPDPVVLHVSPHPDDELLGAPATLFALRDAGWRVVNLVCSLGRPGDQARRHGELVEACRRARFELTIPTAMPAIGSADDLDHAQSVLAAEIAARVDEHAPRLLVGPSPHDGHHGHEVVGRAVRDAVEAGAGPARVFLWGMWADLPLPNVLVGFGDDRLAEIDAALGAHAGELARGRYDRLLASRAAANAVLGPERVFGFGGRVADDQYAELVTDVAWSQEGGWRLMTARMLDGSDPLGAEEGAEVGWWLHSPSVRGRAFGP